MSKSDLYNEAKEKTMKLNGIIHERNLIDEDSEFTLHVSFTVAPGHDSILECSYEITDDLDFAQIAAGSSYDELLKEMLNAQYEIHRLESHIEYFSDSDEDLEDVRTIMNEIY